MVGKAAHPQPLLSQGMQPTAQDELGEGEALPLSAVWGFECDAGLHVLVVDQTTF